jgi:hypothetical protein
MTQTVHQLRNLLHQGELKVVDWSSCGLLRVVGHTTNGGGTA